MSERRANNRKKPPIRLRGRAEGRTRTEEGELKVQTEEEEFDHMLEEYQDWLFAMHVGDGPYYRSRDDDD